MIACENSECGIREGWRPGKKKNSTPFRLFFFIKFGMNAKTGRELFCFVNLFYNLYDKFIFSGCIFFQKKGV